MLAADLEEKKRYLKMAADDGYPAARYELGMPMDNSEKRQHQLKTAADQGSPYHMYEYAIGISDRDEKLLYLKMAADKKFFPAMYELGHQGAKKEGTEVRCPRSDVRGR